MVGVVKMFEVLKLSSQLVRCGGVGTDIAAVVSMMKKYLDDHGFKTEIIDCYNEKAKMPALYATIGTGKKHLLFNGHLDVVPAGDAALWSYPPFEAEIHDDVLYGRGIADMKGGVAAFTVAVSSLASEKKLNGRVSLLLSTDEEEPVVNTTQKALEILAERGEKFDFALVGEPSNPEKIGEEIKIGRRGDVILRLTSYGVQGHTAYPHLADNPIHHLVNLLARIQNDVLDNGNDFFSPSSMQVTTFDVGNAASNVIPEKAFAQIDVRFNCEQTSQKIIERVRHHIKETDGHFELSYEVVGESFLSPVTSEIELLKDVIREICQCETVYSTSGGTSDARFVRQYCPVAEFGLTNATIHKIDERESVANLICLQNIYQKFVTAYFTLS